MLLGLRHQSTVPVEALHTTLVKRIEGLRHTGVDRDTIISRRCSTGVASEKGIKHTLTEPARRAPVVKLLVATA
jgi:hypothetical protein